MTIWWFLSQWREEFSLKWQWTTLHFHFQVLLKDNLTDDNFQRILAVIWESSAQVDYMPKTPFSLLVSFSDPGGDNLPVHREQEASDLLQNPPGNPQGPLRLLLWGPHAKRWNSYQVNRPCQGQLMLILIMMLILILMPLLILILIPFFHLRMRQLLQLYASDSADLISRYYWERIKEQRNLQVFNI